MATPTFYARPQGERRLLSVAPGLASWDTAGSPSQARSTAFIDDVHDLVSADIASMSGPVGLALDVGLPSSVPVFALSDLDNYLFPLIPKLSARSRCEFATIHATKRHAADSFVRVAAAVPAEPAAAAYSASIVTTAAASTTAFKEQIRDQLVGAGTLPGNGVRLELAFVVGPRRAWPNLWKATIDSLGRLLGWDDGAGEWNARDGRITDLLLHCTTDPTVGNQVHIALRVGPTDVMT